MIVRSILANDKSSSDLISGPRSSGKLTSLTCSLKKLVCGGNNASISLLARVTTPLAPCDCHGVVSFTEPLV